MNRQERRRALALAAKTPLPKARADGRPLYYDISAGDSVLCYHCIRAGLSAAQYRRGQAVMNDPANSPTGDKEIVTICVHHLPDNAVIYDATSNKCRNKTGDHEWMEDAPVTESTFKT